MKAGDELKPLRDGVQCCKIIATPIPPEKWTVRYSSGLEKQWSKSHLKKYYMVIEKELL